MIGSDGSMTAGGLEKKFDVSGYLKRIEQLRKGIDEGREGSACVPVTLGDRSSLCDPRSPGNPPPLISRLLSVLSTEVRAARHSHVLLLSGKR